MAWRRPGDKAISEPMMVNLPTHIGVTRPQRVNWICYIKLHKEYEELTFVCSIRIDGNVTIGMECYQTWRHELRGWKKVCNWLGAVGWCRWADEYVHTWSGYWGCLGPGGAMDGMEVGLSGYQVWWRHIGRGSPRSYARLYSLSGKTSYSKISWSLEAARFGFKLFRSLWNLAGNSAALLPKCLSNFRAIRPLQHPISRLRDFTRFGGKTSYRLVNRDPDDECPHCLVRERVHIFQI